MVARKIVVCVVFAVLMFVVLGTAETSEPGQVTPATSGDPFPFDWGN